MSFSLTPFEFLKDLVNNLQRGLVSFTNFIVYPIGLFLSSNTTLSGLIILGDVSPAGAGISSVSQSIDGMSQSTSTAISATNNLFGARVLTNDKKLKENLKTLKKRYKRVGFVVA
jgi:hypothetical protein